MKLGAREQNKSMTTLLFQHNLQHSHVCEMDETWSSFPFSFPFFNMVPRQNVSAATVQGKKKKKKLKPCEQQACLGMLSIILLPVWEGPKYLASPAKEMHIQEIQQTPH